MHHSCSLTCQNAFQEVAPFSNYKILNHIYLLGPSPAPVEWTYLPHVTENDEDDDSSQDDTQEYQANKVRLALSLHFLQFYRHL